MTQKVNFKSAKLQSFNPKKVPWLNAEKIDAKISIQNYDNAKIYCFATLSSNQSIANTTNTQLNITNFNTNDTRMSQTSWRICIQTWWIYLINVGTAWENRAGGVMRQAELKINNNTLSYSNAFLSNNSCNNLTYICSLKSGDFITVQVYQDSWASLNVQVFGTFLQVAKL